MSWQQDYNVRKHEWPAFLRGEHVIMYGVSNGALHLYRGDPRAFWWVEGETKPPRKRSRAERNKMQKSIEKQMKGEKYY